jgi:hypothetical protein
MNSVVLTLYAIGAKSNKFPILTLHEIIGGIFYICKMIKSEECERNTIICLVIARFVLL